MFLYFIEMVIKGIEVIPCNIKIIREILMRREIKWPLYKVETKVAMGKWVWFQMELVQ